MKTRNPANPKKNNLDLNQIPPCYDLAEAKKAAKEQGMKASPAIAWLGGGRVRFSLEKNFVEGRSGYQNLVSIFIKWLGETCLIPNANLPSIGGRFVRCIVASRGDTWKVCDELKVMAILSSRPGAPPGKNVFFMPLEDTIFDPDKDPAIWLKDVLSDDLERSIRLGKELLWEIAVVYSQALERSDDFEVFFEAEDPRGLPTEYSRAVQLLKDCKRAVINLIDSVGAMTIYKRKPATETAVRQGFLIGRWLARAEAILCSSADLKMAAQQGDSGQKLSDFWVWMVDKLEDQELKRKSAREIFDWLNGRPDPETKRSRMTIRQTDPLDPNTDELLRKGRPPVKFSSFRAGLSRAKRKVSRTER
jgi:hypothetical protein